MLKDLNFSDIILMASGQAYLKGTPELGQQLRLLTPDLVSEEELGSLLETVEKAFDRMKEKSFLTNIRIRHAGIAYRAANYQDVDSNIYFLRRLADTVPDFKNLGLETGIADWLLGASQQKGLVLFCGAQASGKTTAASALVASRLLHHGGHAITFERPVEMPLSGKHGEFGFCFQTEIKHEHDLANYIEVSYRLGSPNILFAGEITNKHAASEVLKISLGSPNQLVITTIHGLDLISALDRLMSFASELDGKIACQNLSQCLLAVIYLELKTSGATRKVSAPQFLLVPFQEKTKGIRAKIREGKISSLENEILQQINCLKYQDIKNLREMIGDQDLKSAHEIQSGE